MNIEEILKVMIDMFQNTDKRLKELNKKQSEWDIKQSELLHYIENHNLDAIKSCKVIKQMKYVRTERRKIKDEINIIQSLKDTLLDKYNNKFIEKDLIIALKNLKALEDRQLNPKFTYQYLTEELEIKDEQIQK